MNEGLRMALIAVEYLAWVGVFGYGVAVLVLGTVKPEEGRERDSHQGTCAVWGWLALSGVDLLLGTGGLLAGGGMLLFFLLNVAVNLPGGLMCAKRAARHPELRWAVKMAVGCLAVAAAAHWTRALLL